MAVDMTRLTAITSTTTVRVSALERIRGYTVKLLVYLKRGERRCCEVASATEQTRHYAHAYLRNMQTYGLTQKINGFWKLTALGDFMADYFLNWLKERKKESRKIVQRKKKEERKIDQTKEKPEPKLQRQTCLSLWLAKSSLSDKEKEVVEMLTRHYEETGSKFLFFKTHYELAERLQVSPAQVTEIMMNLQQDHIAYHWRDKSHDAWKIGLYKAFVEVIAKQEP